MVRVVAVCVSVVVLGGVGGCSRTSANVTSAPKDPAAACVKEGDNCEYAPGKLGLCTTKASGCDGGGSCFACMSLH